MYLKRRRFKQTISLRERLAAFATETRARAEQLSGPERDVMLKKVQRADAASRIDAWANSSGLQPPK
jgi:hypothetical protein